MFAITLLLLAETMYLYRKNASLRMRNTGPNTFNECLREPDRILRNNQQTTCITKYGDAFVQPIPAYHTLSTTDWNTYTNHNFFFTYKCPLSSQHTVTTATKQDGIIVPLAQESCIENEDQVNISVWNIRQGQTFTQENLDKELSGASLQAIEYTQNTTPHYQKITYKEQNESYQIQRSVILYIMPGNIIRIEGFSQPYVDAIASTFAFID